MAADPDRAGGRGEQAADHLDRRGLARAVGPEKREQLARRGPSGRADRPRTWSEELGHACSSIMSLHPRWSADGCRRPDIGPSFQDQPDEGKRALPGGGSARRSGPRSAATAGMFCTTSKVAHRLAVPVDHAVPLHLDADHLDLAGERIDRSASPTAGRRASPAADRADRGHRGPRCGARRETSLSC